MKKVAQIDPEKEYEIAKNLIDVASKQILDDEQAGTLDSSVKNLITAARVLIEREERRRGHPKPPPKDYFQKGRKTGETREESSKLPSVKYPDTEVVEEIVMPKETPTCPCCSKPMKESGLYDTNEKLEVIPKRYYIKRFKRPKFNCPNCYGAMVNTPALPSIVPTSNYGDSLIIDVALSKYCDLIPIERYVQMAIQSGLNGDLPPQSLIGTTHHLANFLSGLYGLLKEEAWKVFILHGDETPHRMLEGDEEKNWYLWGFFHKYGCFFEAKNTRSGDVAFDNLIHSKAKYLVTDGYTGYSKAIKKLKAEHNKEITLIYCNAHAYRYFKDASITWKEEAEIFLKLYGQIYELERSADEMIPEEKLKIRQQMKPLFDEIKSICEREIPKAMPSSLLLRAMKYFINHYDGLTICTDIVEVPLDNNLSERELRGPVIGRKVWFGTHSKRGAETAAILFSIVRSCKLNKVNPRHYLPWVVDQILNGRPILTPYEYSKSIN